MMALDFGYERLQERLDDVSSRATTEQNSSVEEVIDLFQSYKGHYTSIRDNKVQFNWKLNHSFDLPDEVYENVDEEEIDTLFWLLINKYSKRFIDFVESFSVVNKTYAEGRMGGWLIIHFGEMEYNMVDIDNRLHMVQSWIDDEFENLETIDDEITSLDYDVMEFIQYISMIENLLLALQPKFDEMEKEFYKELIDICLE